MRALWFTEDLCSTSEGLRNGTGPVRQVSRTYKVPACTLARTMTYGKLPKEKLGRKSCVTSVPKASSVKCIQNMDKHGFAVQNNIPNSFNIDKKQTGYDWLVSSRHQELSI